MATWVQPPNTPKSEFWTALPTRPTRVVNTIYQAGATARQVTVECTATTGAASLEIGLESDLSDAVSVCTWSNVRYSVTATVPPEAYYRVATTGSSVLGIWAEGNL